LLSSEVLYQKAGDFQIGLSVKIRVNLWLNCVCVTREHGGADCSAIETKLRGHDLGGFEAWLEGPAFYFLDDWVED
jgi:hypothetical protein